jgi:hypothetical protein
LGCGNFSLEPGETFTCSFELQLNMANGTFQAVAAVYRYDTETLYDRWESAACIYVGSPNDVRGAVNCFPKVVRHEILKANDAAVGREEQAPASDASITDAQKRAWYIR